MSRSLALSMIASALVVGGCFVNPVLAWEENGQPICTESGGQEGLQIIPDGEGGFFIIWQDMRNGDWDIYAQRFGLRGEPVWGPDDLAISVRDNDQTDPQAVTDGAGGIWVVWIDQRSSRDIYGQHVAADGTFSWQENGAPVCSAQADQFDARIVADGFGGLVAVWTDTRSLDGDIYAQHINGAGNFLWQYYGNLVCNNGLNQTHPEIALLPGTDWDDTRVTVVWEDARNGSLDIYAQRMTLAGEMQWGAAGLPVGPTDYDQERPQVIGGLSGSSFVAWEENKSSLNYYDEVDLRQLDRYGNPSFLTSPYGHAPRLEPDGLGGVLMGYTDHTWDQNSSDPYLRRFNEEGTFEFLVSLTGNFNFPPLDTGARVAPDGIGGGIACYFNNYYAQGHRIEAKRVSAAGEADVWSGYAPVCSLAEYPWGPEIIMLDENYVLVAWCDNRDLASTGEDIYAQRLAYADGAWGYMNPYLVEVADLPGDSGGAVVIHLEASDKDIEDPMADPITGYNVWRRIDGAPGRSLEQSQVLHEMSNPDKAAGLLIDDEMATRLGFPEGSWISLGFHAATQQREYNLFVPTMNDSSAAGIPWETFVVTAHTPAPAVYYVSNQASGYSVDNSPADELSDAGEGIIPRVVVLAQNQPNPFNASTTIGFHLAQEEKIDLLVFDLTGRLVNRLVSGRVYPPGHHDLVWNGKDENGRMMASGTYCYRLEAGGFRESRQMVLLK